MSSSGRADGRTGTPRDVFPMPRDSSFSCASDSGKDKRKERDAFTRRLSSSISLDAVALASKRRPAPGGGSELTSYSGRSVGVSSNGCHDDVISRSKNLVDSGTRCGSGSSVGGVASPSPRLDCSSADDSPRELDGYRFSKPSSPLFTQSRISPLAQSSHNSFTGKGVLAREHSRCSEWDSPFKMDMEYRDKIWGRSEILKRTGSSSYEAATALNTHKDIAGKREQDGYGGSGDSTGSSSYHIRSYQEWRPSSALPLRTHVSNNGHLKESAVREQGLSDVLGSFSSNWHSPLSSPGNYTVDGGRDDGSQTSPRKRPRLGWGQGLAKYEKKLTGGAEDGLGSRGRASSCSEEILLSHADSPHQGTGHGQEALSTKVVADGYGGACVEMDKDISAIQMDQAAGPGIGDEIEKIEEVGSMPTSEMVGLDSCKNSDASFVSKLCQNSETSIQMQPQTVLPGQFGSEDDSGRLKANILQRLEKLELELDLTEKEYAKLEVQPEVHSSSNVSAKIDSMVDVARNLVVADVQPDVHALGQKDSLGEVTYTTEVRQAGKEVVDDQIGMSSSRIQENSLCLHSKTDSKQSSFEVHRSLSFDSFPTVSVSSKGEDGIIQADGCNSQRSSLKGSSQSAASFSDPGEMTGVTDSKEVNANNLLINTRGQFSNIPSKPGVSLKNDASECWKVLYNDNQEQAERTSKVLANLLPDAKVESGMVPVGKSKDMLIQEECTESKERIKQQLQDMLSKKNKIVRFREQVLSLRYRAMRETWKHEQAGLCQWSDRSEGVKKCDIDRRNGTLTPSQRTSHRLRLSGNAKLDAASDEVQTMQKLMAEPLSGYQRTHLKMPCQILDEKEISIQRFIYRLISNNALIEDPIAFEQERKTINPWTPEEKKIFLDTFFLYNKNFQKIASFIEHKTVADCIEFYYRNQKSDEFEMVRRRQRLKNRRDYSVPSAYLATTTPPSNRRREMAAISVDNLPDPASVNSDNGGVAKRSLSKNVDNNWFVSVVSSNIDNPLGNSGSVTGRNVTTDHSNKVNAVQSPRLATTITEEFDSQWTDHERQLFVTALAMFGKDFKNISQHVATKSEGQCKAFFSKTRKRLGLDQLLEAFQMSMHEDSEQQVGGDTEDLNTAVALEDSNCRGMGGMQDDGKNVNATNVGECLPLGSDAIAGVVSADSTEEPLIAESKDSDKGDDKQNIEDERSIVLITELKDDLPEDTVKKASNHGIEEVTEKAVEVLFPEPLSELKDEVDYPGITTDIVTEPETCGRVEDSKDQQKAYVDEQIPSTPQSKSGREDETNESTSVVDTIERPDVEEKDLQPDPLSQVRQESSDVTHMSHNSSNQTSVAPTSTNASIVASMGQPKARGNTSAGESKPRREATSWTQDEKEKFVDIIRKHGRDWTLLQESLPAKSMTQIKTYFQNSKAKLGFTAGEGTNSRSAANRKHKVDDSDSTNTLYNLAHHKAASLSDESGLKSDQNVSGSISTMLGAPGSDALSFTLFGKGKWPAEDPTAFSGMQKVFQQMCSNGYTQQSVPSNGLFPLFQPSALPVLTPGFQQPQNIVLQQSLSHSTPAKPQLAAPQQTQQIASVQQSQTSSTLSNLQTQVVNQIKQQQKPSQVIAHCQQDYQSQGNQQLQKWILQQQAVQSFQQNILPSVLQQQAQPQTQVIIQQQNQPQHLSQSSHHAQHAIKQNIHYLQQQPSIQAFGQQAAVASQQLSSNHHQKVINQHQLSNQQQLMNQLQLHYDDQQKQYHLVPSNQLSQQQQHSILGSLQEQLVLQLHHHQQNLQSEKQQQPIWTNLPVHLLDNSGVSHHQQVQNPDILSEKEKMQRQELYNCQSVSLHKGASQVLSKDASNLPDPIEPKNIPKSQQHDSGHLQESQVDMQVLAHPQSKPVAFAESHPTRAGDVKLFGQVLVSQPTSCMNITPSPSENAFSQPAFSLVSVPASTVVVSVSEGLPDTYPDGTPCVPSGLGRIGPSFTQGHGFNLPWQSTSAGGFGGRNNLLDGRQLACFVKRSDSENDMQNSQVALSRMAQRLIRDTKECDNNCPEGASPSQKFEGCEQLKRMQDDQNAVTGLGIKRSIDQGNVLILNGDLSASNSDLKSDMPRVPGIADLSSMLSRNKDLDMSSTVGAMLGVPVSSTQALPGTVVDAHLAIADWHNSRELRFVGSHSSKELHQSQDFPGNKVCHANDAGKLVITNNQPLPLAHSFAVGVENSQFTRENSFFGQQAILPGSGNVGLNMSMWNSGTVVGSGNDLLRVNMPTVSSVWAHHSMTVESRPRTADSRDAEDNKRNT